MSQPPKRICDLVDARDDYQCVRCGRSLFSLAGSRHHRKLRSQGGKHLPSVLILLCGSGTTGCHGWAHGNPLDAKAGGWYVRSYEDTEKTPVQYPDGRFYMLCDVGHRHPLLPDGSYEACPEWEEAA